MAYVLLSILTFCLIWATVTSDHVTSDHVTTEGPQPDTDQICDSERPCYNTITERITEGDEVSLICQPHHTTHTYCNPIHRQGLLYQVHWFINDVPLPLNLKPELRGYFEYSMSGRCLTVRKPWIENMARNTYKCMVKIYNPITCCRHIQLVAHEKLWSISGASIFTKAWYRVDRHVSSSCVNSAKRMKVVNGTFTFESPSEEEAQPTVFTQSIVQNASEVSEEEARPTVFTESIVQNASEVNDINTAHDDKIPSRNWVRSVLYFSWTKRSSEGRKLVPGLEGLRISHYYLLRKAREQLQYKRLPTGYMWTVLGKPDDYYVHKVLVKRNYPVLEEECTVEKGYISQGRVAVNDFPIWTFTPYTNHTPSVQQTKWKVKVNNPDVGRLECRAGDVGRDKTLMVVDTEIKDSMSECEVSLKPDINELRIVAGGSRYSAICVNVSYDIGKCGRGILSLFSAPENPTFRWYMAHVTIFAPGDVGVQCVNSGDSWNYKWEFVYLQHPNRVFASSTVKSKLVKAPVKLTTAPTPTPTLAPILTLTAKPRILPMKLLIAVCTTAPGILVLLIAAVLTCRCRGKRKGRIVVLKANIRFADPDGVPISDTYIEPCDFKVLFDGEEPTYSSTDSRKYILPVTKWEIKPKRLVMGPVVGKGQFGQVNIAMLDGDQKVAVKTLKEGATEQDLADLLRELALMQYIGNEKNPHMIKLIGSLTQGKQMGIVTNYAEHGCLLKYMQEKWAADADVCNIEFPKTDFTMTKFSFDIAMGMEFLASKRVVHRDLAARNMLLDGSGNLLISDFGLTRWTGESLYYSVSSKTPLPVRWMAPESLQTGRFSPETDVWSFGVTVWEIFTAGALPYTGLSNDFVLDKIKEGEILPQPDCMTTALYSLVKHTWHRQPKHRPTFSQIAMILAALLEPLDEQSSQTKLKVKQDNAYV